VVVQLDGQDIFAKSLMEKISKERGEGGDTLGHRFVAGPLCKCQSLDCMGKIDGIQKSLLLFFFFLIDDCVLHSGFVLCPSFIKLLQLCH